MGDEFKKDFSFNKISDKITISSQFDVINNSQSQEESAKEPHLDDRAEEFQKATNSSTDIVNQRADKSCPLILNHQFIKPNVDSTKQTLTKVSKNTSRIIISDEMNRSIDLFNFSQSYGGSGSLLVSDKSVPRMLNSKFSNPNIKVMTQKRQNNSILSKDAPLIKEILLSAAQANKIYFDSKAEEKVQDKTEQDMLDVTRPGNISNRAVDYFSDKRIAVEKIDPDENNCTKMELNIISNTSVHFSNDELRNLISSNNKHERKSSNDTFNMNLSTPGSSRELSSFEGKNITGSFTVQSSDGKSDNRKEVDPVKKSADVNYSSVLHTPQNVEQVDDETENGKSQQPGNMAAVAENDLPQIKTDETPMDGSLFMGTYYSDEYVNKDVVTAVNSKKEVTNNIAPRKTSVKSRKTPLTVRSSETFELKKIIIKSTDLIPSSASSGEKVVGSMKQSGPSITIDSESELEEINLQNISKQNDYPSASRKSQAKYSSQTQEEKVSSELEFSVETAINEHVTLEPTAKKVGRPRKKAPNIIRNTATNSVQPSNNTDKASNSSALLLDDIQAPNSVIDVTAKSTQYLDKLVLSETKLNYSSYFLKARKIKGEISGRSGIVDAKEILIQSPEKNGSVMGTSLDSFEKKLKELSTSTGQKYIKNEDTSLEENIQAIQVPAETVTPVVPKKRGRPRKNENTPVHEVCVSKKDIELKHSNVEPLSKVCQFLTDGDMELSKSGRKRKRINYFNMENSFIEHELQMEEKQMEHSLNGFRDLYVKIPKKKSKYDSKVNKILQKKIKLETTVSENNSDEMHAVLLKEEMVSLEPRKFDQEPEDVKNIYLDFVPESEINKLMENSPALLHNEKIQKSESEGENSKVSNQQFPEGIFKKSEDHLFSQKNRRYTFTGETKKMMKSVFSAAFQNLPEVTGASTDSVENQYEKSAVSNFHNQGWVKKSDQESSILHEDGKVICTICKIKMYNEEWQLHNRSVHYNLSWREGEPFLNIDDVILLKKTLKPILQEEKTLICKNCDSPFYAVVDFISHKEECDGVVLGGQVTCAVCKEQLEKSKWNFHKKRKHNNLAWRVGDPPMDLNNQPLILNILNSLYKAKIPLYCYKCNTSKKSVVGFLSHQSQCGISIDDAKVKCQYCDSKVLPVSMPSHIKFVHETQKEKKSNDKLGLLEMDSNASLKRRKAAQNASMMIDNISKENLICDISKHYSVKTLFKDSDFAVKLLEKEYKNTGRMKCKFHNCNFEAAEIELMLDHLDNCQHKPEQYFICEKCFSINLLEEDIKQHIIDNHNSVADLDNVYTENDSDEEEQIYKQLVRQRKIDHKRVASNSHLKVKPRCISHIMKPPRGLFMCAFEYTLEFCNEHYTQSLIFDKLYSTNSDWFLLDEGLLEQYLPKKEVSSEVSRMVVNGFENVLEKEHIFKKFDLFEIDQQDNVTTVFCGGPIFALAWLPTPHILLHCNQILAVTVGDNFDSKYSVNTNYSEKCAIQFWDFGILKKKVQPSEPKLLFCLSIDYGPIWHLEWCPSGCYKENRPSNNGGYKRMGLLAVAGSSPTVCIYDVPFLNKEDEKEMVYACKPLMKLQLTLDTVKLKRKYFPTKIAWSKASKHRYIAIGYTDGMVAIFDMEAKSETLMFTGIHKEKIMLPYKTIKAHTHYITALSIIHLKGGDHWLFTGSFDCDINVWDLTNTTKISHRKKKMVTDGTWLTNWVAFVSTTDESNSKNVLINAAISSHRNYLYEHTHFSNSPTTLSTVSTSDWLNGIMHGSTSGEIITIFPHQLLYSVDNDKKLKYSKYVLGYTKLIDKYKLPHQRVLEEAKKQKALKPYVEPVKHPSPDSAAALFRKPKDHYNEYEPGTYEETNHKYGLVFCDWTLNHLEDFPANQQDRLSNPENLEVSKPNLYPIQKINKVCFNPNCQSSLYFTAGYQAGFIRLFYMKFLESDKQVV